MLYEKLIQVVLPAALIVSGCVSLSSQGQGVVVADTEDEVAACKNLGEVLAEPPFFGTSDAKNTLRNEAGVLGGNTILITRYSIGTAKAQAYRCDP